uniref:Uncharacterized protein n=1 Tax=Anopheles epiroticus TaxID=199890 RepID=A0A182P007_9DIPT
MTTSHVSPQVCRPHFHGPLSWLSDPPKPIASGSAWGNPFACPQDPQDKLAQVQTGQSGQHLFSFPPTPPKDSTPDSVQTAPAEYQATINAFMHQAQVGSSNALGGGGSVGAGLGSGTGGQTADGCGLDVKPCLTGGNGSSGSGGGGSGGGGGGQNQPKQREGTGQSGGTVGNGSSGPASHGNGGQPTGSGLGGVQQHGGQSGAPTGHTSGGGGGGGGLFDGTGQSAYGGGYDTSGYGYHHQHAAAAAASFGQSNPRPTMNSPHMKPQRTKARTSAVGV